MRRAAHQDTAMACDCCGASAWRFVFSEHDIDLGRCGNCGLYYVAQIPGAEHRIAEMESGHFANDQLVADAELHLQSEQNRRTEFQSYIDVLRALAPEGMWLDIGCGTGTLIALAQQEAIEIEGIELTADRRELAQQFTGAVIHDQPLESLSIQQESIAAVTMINVFSHLISPRETLSHIHHALVPGGVLLLRTGEIGPGVKKHHSHDWSLGDHLYFLGLDTIDFYARTIGFQVAHRDRQWQPSVDYSRERFRMKGRSRLRNFVKSAFLYTPGAFPLLRWYSLTKWQVGNPVHISTLVLKKTGG